MYFVNGFAFAEVEDINSVNPVYKRTKNYIGFADKINWQVMIFPP
jgi:hypothetical protein